MAHNMIIIIIIIINVIIHHLALNHDHTFLIIIIKDV
jgi:hypothetical protein